MPAEEFIGALKDYWLARTELELALGGSIKDVSLAEQPIIKSEVPIYPANTSSIYNHHHGE